MREPEVRIGNSGFNLPLLTGGFMRSRRAKLIAAFAIACFGAIGPLHSQTGDSKPSPPVSKPNHKNRSGSDDPAKYKRVAGAVDFTLQRARDYHFVAGNVDCPNCKDLYSATVSVPVAGATITSITYKGGSPTTNNHWYRCGVQARCGVGEFSAPNNAAESCGGQSTCNVNRASDDSFGGYEDYIHMTYQ